MDAQAPALSEQDSDSRFKVDAWMPIMSQCAGTYIIKILAAEAFLMC